MKKRFIIIPVVIAACCVLAFSGCTSSSITTVVALDSNWYRYTKYKGIQDYFTYKEDESELSPYYSPEELEYDVEFIAADEANSTYTVAYEGGKYTTEFYAKTFPTALIADDYKEGYDEVGSITAYYYRTELTFDYVTFTYTGTDATGTDEDSISFDGDTAVTECYFLSCTDFLRPLYSYQKIVSHSPAVYQATSLASTYTAIDCEYTTQYSYDATEATVTYTDNSDSSNSYTNSMTVDSTTTFFDNSSLDIAVRGMSDLSSTLSQSVELFIPKQGIATYTLTGSETEFGTEEELEAVTDILRDNGLFIDSEDEETSTDEDADEDEDTEESVPTVDTVAISVVGSGNLANVYQTYWYAAISNRTNNVGRATMLRISSPLSYNLGSLVYTLSDVKSTLWDGIIAEEDATESTD